jgi:hypothetical protein
MVAMIRLRAKYFRGLDDAAAKQHVQRLSQFGIAVLA